MTRPALHLAVAPRDPLSEAPAEGWSHLDAGLNALQVALAHFARAEPYAPLLPPGVLAMVEAWQRTIPADMLRVVSIMERTRG